MNFDAFSMEVGVQVGRWLDGLTGSSTSMLLSNLNILVQNWRCGAQLQVTNQVRICEGDFEKKIGKRLEKRCSF